MFPNSRQKENVLQILVLVHSNIKHGWNWKCFHCEVMVHKLKWLQCARITFMQHLEGGKEAVVWGPGWEGSAAVAYTVRVGSLGSSPVGQLIPELWRRRTQPWGGSWLTSRFLSDRKFALHLQSGNGDSIIYRPVGELQGVQERVTEGFEIRQRAQRTSLPEISRQAGISLARC